jgi:hypothetical protein
VTIRTKLSLCKCFEVFTEGVYSDSDFLGWGTYRRNYISKEHTASILKIELCNNIVSAQGQIAKIFGQNQERG